MKKLLAKMSSSLVQWTGSISKAMEDQAREDILYDLERLLDPLIARQSYNHAYSPLLRLSPRILLSVMEYLAEDEVHFFVLRLVCRRFRLLLAYPRFGRHKFTLYHDPCTLAHCDGTNPNCRASPKIGFQRGRQNTEYRRLSDRIIALLWRDELCGACFRVAVDQQADGHRRSLCKFRLPSNKKTKNNKYCTGCRMYHPLTLFPVNWLGGFTPGKKCIGRFGYVNICQHSTFTWAEVEFHMTNAKMIFEESRRKGRGNRKSIRLLIKQCKHSSHKWPCGRDSEGPRAMLDYKGGQYDILITWTGHSGYDAFPRAGSSKAACHKLSASAARDMFQSHRRDTAQYVLPQQGPGLPEMAAFDRTFCSCLNYIGEAGGGGGGSSSSQDTAVADRGLGHRSPHMRIHDDLKGEYHTVSSSEDASWATSQHSAVQTCVKFCSYPDDTRRRRQWQPCIATTYTKSISGMSMPDEVGAPPSHAWLHAMDRMSYRSGLDGLGMRETCDDHACTNSHQQLRCDADLHHLLNNRNAKMLDERDCFY